MAYVKGNTGSFVIHGTKDLDFKVYWEETYELNSNTSIIVLKPYCIIQNLGGGTRYYPDGTISCNGVQLIEMDSYHGTHYFDAAYQTEKYIRIATSNGPQLVLTSDAITHNDDGSKSVIISVDFKGYSSGGVGISGFHVSGSQTITLTHIPRASSITSASNITLGNSCNIKWTPASSDFKYKIKFSLGSWNYTTEFIAPNTTDAYTYTGDVTLKQTIVNITTIYAQLPTSTSGTMTAYLYTYNSSDTQIGNASSKTFTVTIPSDVKPQLGTITLNPTDINSNNILVQGKNALTISVSGCSAGTGSSIKSYTFEGPSLSKTVTSTSTSASTSVSSVTSTGNLTYKITVTDTRGRTASGTQTIICYEYSSPYFTSFNAYRADESGNPNLNGTYLQCDCFVSYATVNSTNSVNVDIYYNGTKTTNTLIDLNGDITTTYSVYAIVTDMYGGTGASSTISVFGQARVLNITQDGTGVAVGKMAESSNLFECRWDAKFNGNVDCTGITVNQQSILDTIKQTIFDSIYPVGSIYTSVNNTNPSNLFGGTWTQIKDTFLLSAGSTYSAGSTGGSATVSLTAAQNGPHTHTASTSEDGSHTHKVWGYVDAAQAAEGYTAADAYRRRTESEADIYVEAAGAHTHTVTVNSSGSGAAHNNMPPYLVVYMWKRTK